MIAARLLRTAVTVALSSAALTTTAHAQVIEPGGVVPELIGINWERETVPLERSGGGVLASLRPLVTATVTAELFVSDLGHASVGAAGHLTVQGKRLREPWEFTRPGKSLIAFDPTFPTSLSSFFGGGVTGLPIAFALRQPAPVPAGAPDDVELLISLTGGP